MNEKSGNCQKINCWGSISQFVVSEVKLKQAAEKSTGGMWNRKQSPATWCCMLSNIGSGYMWECSGETAWKRLH